MKPIAVIFSDLHLGEYSRFNKDNKRVLNHFKVLTQIRKVCLKYDIPSIFCGDLFHKPEVQSNEFFELVVKQFDRLDKKKWTMYCISGNHDMSKRNTKEASSPSWVKSYSKQYNFIKCIDWKTIEEKAFNVSGIPYLDSNLNINNHIKNLSDKKLKNHLLLLHTDYPGAQDTDDTEVGDVQNLNINLLNPFRLTLIGHIHKPQRLGRKVYMVGAPLQQRRTDRKCELGYWLLYEDFSMEFHPMNFPKFIDVDKEEDVKDDGNYYTVISKEPLENVATHAIKKDTSKRRLVRNYMKATGNKDKAKRQILIDLLKKTDGIR